MKKKTDIEKIEDAIKATEDLIAHLRKHKLSERLLPEYLEALKKAKKELEE